MPYLTMLLLLLEIEFFKLELNGALLNPPRSAAGAVIVTAIVAELSQMLPTKIRTRTFRRVMIVEENCCQLLLEEFGAEYEDRRFEQNLMS